MKIDPSYAESHPELYEMIRFYNLKRESACWDDLIGQQLVLVDAAPDKIVWEFEVQETHCNQ